MAVITLELPEEIVTRWKQLPDEEWNVFALADLVEELEEAHQSLPVFPPTHPLSPEDIENIRQGFEDSDAGRVIDGDTPFRELYERVGLKYCG